MASSPDMNSRIVKLLENVDPDLAAVLGPSLVETIVNRIAVGQSDGHIAHVISSGESLEMMEVVQRAIEVLGLIKVCLEIHDPTQEKKAPALVEETVERLEARGKAAGDGVRSQLRRIADAVAGG